MKDFILISVFVFSTFFSCDIEEKYTSTFSMVGLWEWTLSRGGIGALSYTPQTSSKKIILEFTEDSLFRKYENDRLILESFYHIRTEKSNFCVQDCEFLDIEGENIRQIIRFDESGNLILSDAVYDGFEHFYKRLN